MARRPPATGKDADTLAEVKLLTRMMREHATQIETLGQRRRRLVVKLRENNIPYREIAEAMETTEQAVYKVLRPDL